MVPEAFYSSSTNHFCQSTFNCFINKGWADISGSAEQEISRAKQMVQACSIAIPILKVSEFHFRLHVFWSEYPKHTHSSRLSGGAMGLDLHISVMDQKALGELPVWHSPKQI